MVKSTEVLVGAPVKATEDAPKVETKDCIFCKIVEGKARSIRVAEDDYSVSFMSLEGHPVVAPRRHIEGLPELNEATEDRQRALVFANRILPAVLAEYEERFGATGIKLQANMGASAGQDVMHFHVHLIPRRNLDGQVGGKDVRIGDHAVKTTVALGIKTRLPGAA